MNPLVFRSSFNRALSAVILVIVAAVVIGAVVLPGGVDFAVPLTLGAIGVAALTWAILWSPHLELDDAGVDVHNVLLDHHVPWEALIHIETRYSLQLHTPSRRISVTGAPAPGAMSAVRAARAQRRSEDAGGVPTLRPGDLPTSDSGRAADLVRGRWHQLRDAGRIEPGLADTAAVITRVRPLPIAAIVVGCGALVLAAFLA